MQTLQRCQNPIPSSSIAKKLRPQKLALFWLQWLKTDGSALKKKKREKKPNSFSGLNFLTAETLTYI